MYFLEIMENRNHLGKVQTPSIILKAFATFQRKCSQRSRCQFCGRRWVRGGLFQELDNGGERCGQRGFFSFFGCYPQFQKSSIYFQHFQNQIFSNPSFSTDFNSSRFLNQFVHSNSFSFQFFAFRMVQDLLILYLSNNFSHFCSPNILTFSLFTDYSTPSYPQHYHNLQQQHSSLTQIQ